MALVLKDRVKETTTTEGTGTLSLLGASTGYQSFSVIGNGNTCYYSISAQGSSEWEVGIGTYTSSGTTLSRDTVLASSNANSLVSLSAGTKDVYVVYPASKSVNLDASNNVSALGTVASGTWQATTIAAGYGGTGLSSAGTAGNVLTSNGSAWVSQAAAAFDSGTRMMFAQTTAPTGWTKDTVNYNNHALRVVTGAAGTGGTVDFTAAFVSQTPTGTVTVSASTGQVTQGGSVGVTVDATTAGGSISGSTGAVTQGGSVSGSTGGTTLSTAEIPGHSHTLPGRYGYTRTNNSVSPGNNGQPPYTPNTGSSGGGGSHSHPFASATFTGQPHSHPFSGSFTGNSHNHTASGSFTGTQHDHPVSAPASFSGAAIDLAVKYLDVITATKD